MNTIADEERRGFGKVGPDQQAQEVVRWITRDWQITMSVPKRKSAEEECSGTSLPHFVVQVLGNFSGCLSLACELVRRQVAERGMRSGVVVLSPPFFKSVDSAAPNNFWSAAFLCQPLKNIDDLEGLEVRSRNGPKGLSRMAINKRQKAGMHGRRTTGSSGFCLDLTFLTIFDFV